MIILSYLIQFLLGLALLTPLIFSRSFIFPLITPKALFFKVIIEIAVFLSLVYLAEKMWRPDTRKAWISDARRFLKNPLTIAVAIFGVISILATIFAVYPWRSFWSTVERGEGLLVLLHVFAFFFLILAFFNSKKDIFRLIKTSIYISVAVGIFGLFQKQLLPFFGSALERRLSGTLGNADFLGVYLFFQILFILMLFMSDLFEWRGKPEKSGALITYWEYYIFGAILCFDFIVFILAGTRSAILGFAVAVLYIFILFAFRFFSAVKNLRLKHLKYAAGFVSLAAVVFGISYFISPGTFKEYSARLDMSHILLSFEQRSVAYKVGLKGFEAKPILGSGFDSFHYYYNKFYEPYFMKILQAEFDRAHNVYIQWMNDTGIFGLLAYLGIFGSALALSWRLMKKNFGLGVGAGAIIAGYAVNNFFILDVLASYVSFFLFLAALVILYKTYVSEKSSAIKPAASVAFTKDKKNKNTLAGFSRKTIILGFALLPVFYLIMNYFALRSAFINVAISDGIQKMRAAKSMDEFKIEFANLNREIQKKDLIQIEAKILSAEMFFGASGAAPQEILKAVGPDILNWFKDEPHKQDIKVYSYYLLRARILNLSGRSVEAVAAIESAMQKTTDKRPELWGELGSAFVALGKDEKARDAFNHFVDYSVNSAQASAYIAAFLQSYQKFDLGYAYLKMALDAGYENQKLVQIYFDFYQKNNDKEKMEFLSKRL